MNRIVPLWLAAVCCGLAACTQPVTHLTIQTGNATGRFAYVPLAPSLRAGPLWPASIEVVPLMAWDQMGVLRRNAQYSFIIGTKISLGQRLREELRDELSGLFANATVTDTPLSAGPPPLTGSDLIAVTTTQVRNLMQNGISVSRLTLDILLVSRANRQLVKKYETSAPLDHGSIGASAVGAMVQNAIDFDVRQFVRQITNDNQLQGMIALRLYQNQGPQIVDDHSPYAADIDAVVRIERPGSIASGFLVSPQGLIITANHVVNGASSVTVKMRDGSRYSGKVVAADQGRDLALVKITDPARHFSILPLSPLENSGTGEAVVAIGTPLGLSWSVTKADVSAVRQLRLAKVLQLDRPLDPGNSGGPVIDAASGKVVGVMSYTEGNQGFAIMAGEARKAFGAQLP